MATHGYQVAAINDSGVGARSATARFAGMAGLNAVLAEVRPLGLTAAAPAVGRVELTWTDGSNGAVTSYRVRRKSGDGAYETLAATVVATNYTDETVESGVSYRYRLVGSSSPALATRR